MPLSHLNFCQGTSGYITTRNLKLCRRRARKKVVATVSRRECACKRAGEPSVPFYEKGGTVKQVTDFFA